MENRNSIVAIPIEEEVQNSYLDYAMSVIVSRALPDVRDGLKPVHRRIIYAMDETGNHHNKPHRKSARVVGEVMGKYHPHGDAAIYDTMVRLAQDFSLRVPLIDGQGNFGSMDGDSAAAPRYTEARMAAVAHEFVSDIDDDTVNFRPNYDSTIMEPTVLPVKFPNLLVNGAGGIAVGMATYIPTHNLGEVIDACCAVIDNPEITNEELMHSCIPGPDFPTGGIIMGVNGIRTAFNTGRGSVLIRSKTSTEKVTDSREAIIVHEIPYQVNKAKLVEKIAELVKDKTVEGISDIRDESNKDGVRIVIELKRDASSEVILNQLYKLTPLQTSIGYNMLALVKNRPVKLSLRSIIDNFIEFRQEVIVRRSKFNLKKSRERAHVLLGFAVAVANIDKIIRIIRQAADKAEAKENLIVEVFDAENVKPMLEMVSGKVENAREYRLTSEQADAILDLRLHRLTGLERDKIQKDLHEVVDQMKELMAILGSKERVIQIIKDEILAIKEKYNTPRLTQIEGTYEDVDIEDLIQKEDMVITHTFGGYIKRVPLSTYRAQKRGGRGRSGMETKEEDVVQDVIIANTHDEVLFFSTAGKVYKMKVYKLPLGSAVSRGRALVNTLPLEEQENISTILVVRNNDENSDKTLIFSTSFGNVRRSKFDDFANIQANGKKAISLDEGEKLICVALSDSASDIFLATRSGICNRFPIDELRIFVGRDSNGVRGIKLKQGDEVMSMAILDKWETGLIDEREQYFKNAEKLRKLAVKGKIVDGLIKDRMETLAKNEKFILTVTENGFGKVSSFYDYRATGRGTQGFTNIAITQRNGQVVASFPVDYETHIMMVTNTGRIMRCSVEEIRVTRRVAQGVILFRLNDGETITSVSTIDETQDEQHE